MQPASRLRAHRSFQLFAAALLVFVSVLIASPARATFHLMEINKVLTSYNGDPTIQAIEMRMLSGGQNIVSTAVIRSYDASGALLATLGTFAANLPAAGALTDRKVLCATSGFASTFGITPDLVITAGIPLGTGQVSFEKTTCLVNAIAYGDVTAPKNGTTSAPAIPNGLAYVLTRTVNNTTAASCPLAEDAGSRFVIRSASTSQPTPFSNNAGQTVMVMSTLTGVGVTPPAPPAPRVFPNPFRGAIRVEAGSAGRVAVFDVQGGLIRVLNTASAPVAFHGEWDGLDRLGKPVPAGVYFISFGSGRAAQIKRVVIVR